MKKIILVNPINYLVYLSGFFILFLTFLLMQTVNGQNLDRSNFDYWHQKMTAPDMNYYQLVEEFENYWKYKDKTNVKGTGYKQFKRWKEAMSGMIGPDGKVIPTSYFKNEYSKFNQLYGDKGIVGTWDFVGPEQVPVIPGTSKKFGIGRMTCIAFHPTDQNTIYVGTNTSGIWKTTTGSNNWTNLNTDQLMHFGVSAIAIHPSNPEIIYLGTGDRDSYMVPGQGVWKSTNGGQIWNQLSSAMDTLLVSEILIQPNWSEVLLAGTQKGIYKSSNSGITWTKTTAINNVKDMVYKPGDPDIVYATANGKFYRSEDSGNSWVLISSTSMPTSGRWVIAVTPEYPDRVYFFTEKDSKYYGFFRSLNSGLDFYQITTNGIHHNKAQGGFNLTIAIDPTDINNIYAGMVWLFKSTDGGTNWSAITDVDYETHPDYHALEFSPHTNHLYIGNDGGLFFTSDNGNTISCISDGLNITQVNRLAISEANPDIFLAGLNDNGTITPVSGNYDRVYSGDGMKCEIDYTNNQYMYTSAQGSHIIRSTSGQNGGWYTITDSATQIPERAGWFRPYILDQDDPNIMFAGNNNIWRTSNVKEINHTNVVWENISDGQLSDDVIEHMEQCTADGKIIYITKGDGSRVYRTNNAYSTNPQWAEIPKPYGEQITSFETHPTDTNIVYISTKEKNLLKSTDQGITWTSIKENLPDLPLYCVLYHIGSNEGLFVSTMSGIYYKDAEMNDWVEFKSDLPKVPVKIMKIIYSTESDKLYAGTWGRGIWKTDVLPVMKPNLTINAAAANVTDTDVEINVGLYNDSEMNDADSYVVGYYLSSNQIISTGDRKIGEDTIVSHPHGVIIGESCNVDVRFEEPEIPPGTYYIGAYTDIYDDVIETNEIDNNITCSSQVTISDPPPAPLNVQASDGDYYDKIYVDWDAPSSPYILYYRIYRNTTNDQNSAIPLGDTWTNSTFFNDNVPINGVDYYYWVKAADNNLGLRVGSFSQYDVGWQFLLPPENCAASKGQFDNHIEITWDIVDGTNFTVFRNTVFDFATATQLYSYWTPFTKDYDYDVVLGTTYYYWVKSAMSDAGYRASPGHSNGSSGYLALVDAPIAIASDGTTTEGIDVSWNSIEGITYYRLFSNTVDDTSTATSVTYWISDTSFLDGTANWGMYHYYWVKASMDPNCNITSGYGESDTGWRSFYPADDVQASNGGSTDHIEITWDNSYYKDYYQVYRSENPASSTALPASGWEEHATGVAQNHYDSTAAAGTYFYWVKISDDPNGEFISDFSSYDWGWRKLETPAVYATYGTYSDKIVVTWDSVPGASTYFLTRSQGGDHDTLSEWTDTLNYMFEDYNINLNEQYTYWLKTAINHSGLRPSETGFTPGFAGECGNLIDDPEYRTVYLHGTTLEITQRVINEGPFPLLNPEVTSFSLCEFLDYYTGIVHNIGTVIINPLDVGEYQDVSLIVNLDTLATAPVDYGTWWILNIMPFGSANCQTNFVDDVVLWDTIPVNYTDALYGNYTIGGFFLDYLSFSDAVSDLINKGISDDVTFNVCPGTYYEQISIQAINGAGPNRTIIFQSDPALTDTAEITYTSNTDNYTVQFDGCSYIAFQNLKISSPGYTNNVSTYGKVISFINDAHHISILNNKISGTADFSFNSTDNCVIYYDNSPCHDLVINDNEILNGSYGIYFHGVGEGVNLSTGVWIENNVIKNFNHMGITLKYQQSPIIYNNIIYYGSTYLTQCYGINLENIEDGFDIRNNKITMEPCSQINIGMNLQHCTGSIGNKGIVGNNFIAMISAANPIYGLIIYNVTETDVLYNSMNITGDINPDNFCINIACTDGFVEDYNNRLINNIFANETNGNCILYSDAAILDDYLTECDFNDYYFTGISIGQYGYGNNIPDLSSWVTVSGFDNNSLNIYPEFFSDTDLHTFCLELNGMASVQSEIYYDIDFEYRSQSNPDIGADEFTPQPIVYDLELYEFLAPTSGSSLGSEELITVYITNEGTEDLWDAPVNYSINGEAPVYEVITEILFAGGEYEYTFTNTADLSQPGLYEIIASINHPDDQFLGNNSDTLIVEHYHPDLCVDNLYVYGCFYFFSYYQITDFSLNTINHLETGCSDNAYGDFTFLSTDLEQNGSYTMEVKLSRHYMYVSMWIDLNDDYIFDPSEIFVNGLYCPIPNTTYSSTVNIPASAQTGQHRMRIRSVYNESNPDPCTQYNFGEVHDYTVNIINEVVQEFDLDLKVYLHGPFNESEMNTDLNSILPLGQPYNTSPWNYLGSETTTLIPNPNIVDWILVELRDTTDASIATPGTTIAQQAAFILKDGSVVDMDGSSNLQFSNSIIQSLFVVIWHRNHIGIISSNPLIRIGEVYSYDFTIDDLQVLGGSLGYKELIPGTWGMASGDGDANGLVESDDKTNIWLPDVGTNGYKVSDFNMDTQVDNKDKNDIWHFNSGKDSQVPY